jgi:signal peptidase I
VDAVLLCTWDHNQGGAHVESGSSFAEPNLSWKSGLLYFVKWILIFSVIIFGVRPFFFWIYIVNGVSMTPTMQDNELVLVNKIVYRFHPPERGDIVVFQATEEEQYIKRVMALPGETIEVIGDVVYINGVERKEPYLIQAVAKMHNQKRQYNEKDGAPFTVSDGHVFVMGDNRSHSTDSRDIGEVPVEDIVGRADIRLWPISKIGMLTNAYDEQQ